MRVVDLLNNIDASLQITSVNYQPDCGQDMRYLIQITKAGVDGNPQLYLEESLDNVVWTCIPNYEDSTQFFLLDEDEIGLRDSYFMGKFIRLRIEPNGTTTGTISAKIGVKTKSV
jgi:hypothetical protein